MGECGGLGDDGCGGSGGGDAGEGGGGGSGEGGGREGGEGGAGREGCGSLVRRTGSGGDGSGGGGGIEGAATNKEPMKPRSARTARMAARRPTMGRRFPRTALILPMHFPKKDPPGLVDSRGLAAAGAAAAPAPALPPFPLTAGAAAGAWAAGLLEAPRAGIAAIAGRPLTAGAIPRSGPFAPDATRQIRVSRPNLRRNDARSQLTLCASLTFQSRLFDRDGSTHTTHLRFLVPQPDPFILHVVPQPDPFTPPILGRSPSWLGREPGQ